MITNLNNFVNESLGSSLALPANGLGGSRATSLLVAHFALQNTASNSAEKKNRRAQIKKCEENFFAGWRGFRATAGLASLLGVLLKKSSNISQKTPPNCT